MAQRTTSSAPPLSVASAGPAPVSWRARLAQRLDAASPGVLLGPAVLLVLFLSIFPLLVSLYLSFARLRFVRDAGVTIEWVGNLHYRKLLLGSEQRRFLGRFGEVGVVGWVLLALLAAVVLVMFVQYLRSQRRSIFGTLMRVAAMGFGGALAYLAALTLSGRGLPGTLVVTLIFVFLGVFFQYMLGLGLAMLLTQALPGKRFFRVLFLLPMMITPVGIGFLFRMMTDTLIGPFAPLWKAAGLVNFSWVDTAWGARAAVLIGDVWQWTPFMFIILLAALEGVSSELIEAAHVDGAGRWAIFRNVLLPQVAPVSITLVLIRSIEAFKIIDLPNIMTRGGPGTATESITLHAYNLWRAQDMGQASALAYMLLIVVTFVALVLVNIVRRRVMAAL